MSVFRNCLLAATLLFAVAAFTYAAPTPPAYHLLASISLPGNQGWDYLTVDSVSRRLYVSRQDHVAVIDIEKNALVGNIENLGGAHGIAIDNADGLGFITDGKANTVVTFDLKSLAKIRETPTGNRADGIVYDPFSKKVFSFNGGDHNATAIDAKSGAVAGTISLPGKPEFPATDSAGHVFDNIEDTSMKVRERSPASLPSQTVRAVFPHTAFHQISPSGHERVARRRDGHREAFR